MYTLLVEINMQFQSKFVSFSVAFFEFQGYGRMYISRMIESGATDKSVLGSLFVCHVLILLISS